MIFRGLKFGPRIFFSLYNEDNDLYLKEEDSMMSIISIIVATIILVVVLKYSYGINNKVRKELESLEEIF